MIKTFLLFFFFTAISQSKFVEEVENPDEEFNLADLFIAAEDAAEYASPCGAELKSVKTCLTDVTSNYNTSNGSELLYDKEFMISMIEDVENAKCFAPSNCANVKVAKYIYNDLLYISKKIYQEGFECAEKIVNNPDALEETVKHCANMILLSGQVKVKEISIDSIVAVFRPLSACVIERQSCSVEEKQALTSAAYKGVELVEAYFHPDNVLRDLGLTEADISKEEVAAVFLFFVNGR